MYLVDCYWTNIVNVLIIECDCGHTFHYPCNYSLVICSNCQNKEVWHEDALKIPDLKKYSLIKNNLYS